MDGASVQASEARQRPQRLRSSQVIGRVFADGDRVRTRSLAMHWMSLPGSTAFTAVATRRLGGAVVRNRAKRLIREAARTIGWTDGLAIVIVARPAIRGLGMAAVAHDLRVAATRAGLVADTTGGAA